MNYEGIEMTELRRSPELCAEIARGKRPVGQDPDKRAYDSLHAAFHARRGPFDLVRFRPPSSTGGTRGDFVVRLVMMKRAIRDGDVYMRRLLGNIGHEPLDLDRAVAHWRAEYLSGNGVGNDSGTVTITALEA